MRGFTLIELSITLVIIGLLAGGILGGQALIRAAELRAVSTEYNRFVTATQTFRDKYFALPGDMTNATAFWGKDATYCNAQAGTAAATGTCNGNGSGLIDVGSAANTTTEHFQFWKQLTLAGLLEGTYTGIAGPGGTGRDAVLGTNAPRSKLGNAGYSIENWGNITATGGVMWLGQYNNIYIFGAQQTINPPENPALRPEEAWNIDTKLDDGKPSQGKVRTFYRHSYATGAQCVTTNDDATSEYLLTSSTIGCNLIFSAGI